MSNRIDWSELENIELIDLYFAAPDGRKPAADNRVKVFAKKHGRRIDAVTMKLGQIDSIVNASNVGLLNIQKSLIDLIEKHGHEIDRNFAKAIHARTNTKRVSVQEANGLYKKAIQECTVPIEIKRKKIFSKGGIILDRIRKGENINDLIAEYLSK